MTWDWVFNLAAETKYSQVDQVYEEKVQTLSVNCAKHAASLNVGVFIELSTAQVYDADKVRAPYFPSGVVNAQKSSKEEAKLKPWTSIGRFKLKAEEEIKAIAGLHHVIVRPAIVYGIGDMSGLSTIVHMMPLTVSISASLGDCSRLQGAEGGDEVPVDQGSANQHGTR